jgi:serine/threonine protein kinase
MSEPETTEPSPLSVRLSVVPEEEPPPPTPPTFQREHLAKQRLGSILKGWRLVRLLGVGPVTAAYEAVKGSGDGAERAVAKVMLGPISAHERARQLFVRASYAANRFTHSRVLPILQDGMTEDGAPFVFHPWTDSEPLAAVVARGEPLTEAQILRIAEQVLDALEIAHAHGIVHGAIVPSNVLVTQRGSIRLIDFATPPGMSRLGVDNDLLAERRIDPFTAPERCGEPAEPASETADVYSVAACMYYAASRVFPRGGAATRTELARTQARPLREVAPDISPFFANVVDHALDLDAARRYETAYAMLGDVRRVMAGRMPKLGQAHAPVPSGSYNGMHVQGAPSSRRVDWREGGPASLSVSLPRDSARREWRGNMVLILAIAALVGVATFVMVREKVEESNNPDPAPPGSAAPAPKSE